MLREISLCSLHAASRTLAGKMNALAGPCLCIRGLSKQLSQSKKIFAFLRGHDRLLMDLSANVSCIVFLYPSLHPLKLVENFTPTVYSRRDQGKPWEAIVKTRGLRPTFINPKA